ncbi:aa3-type cytochrome c oxidase subunit IV [Novosphingobium sp. G106]|uniref:aa3-type cytochrome c oxidase subunit IV n=1 Tax=Novosphingobium sp. G106 TaxID=2849500 RepID=UPI0020C20D02|nr:aa3-type cytochrome c oxidase subunit IV [Novosphingobium sp. G106]
MSEFELGDRGLVETPIPNSRMDRMASGNDMKAANETYAGFINMIKYGAIAVAIIAVFVVGLIASHR